MSPKTRAAAAHDSHMVASEEQDPANEQDRLIAGLHAAASGSPPAAKAERAPAPAPAVQQASTQDPQQQLPNQHSAAYSTSPAPPTQSEWPSLPTSGGGPTRGAQPPLPPAWGTHHHPGGSPMPIPMQMPPGAGAYAAAQQPQAPWWSVYGPPMRQSGPPYHGHAGTAPLIEETIKDMTKGEL